MEVPNLIIIHGLSGEESLNYVREQIERQPHYRNLPIVPVGLEAKIIPLRIEPEIEDEP